MGITASNLSFGEVNRRFYGRKLRFTAPLTRRRKTKFPTVKPPQMPNLNAVIPSMARTTLPISRTNFESLRFNCILLETVKGYEYKPMALY